MADGRVVFEVTADSSKALADIKNITKEIDKESKKWDNSASSSAEESTGAWTKAIGSIVGTLSAAAVVSTFAKWGKAAIDAASDLQEVQNVVDVTFGDSSGKIDAWAKNAGKQYGITETAAKRYTSTIGAMLKSQGMADDEIVKTSTDLAGLAADMASFYNLDADEAFQKIRSGISGETEPLKALGINMSAANLEAFRLQQGIEKTYASMSQGEQTMLRYQYLMQATADAQGDFSRTADGFANASRRMDTAIDTISTKLGEILLPVVSDIVGGFADFLEMVTTSDFSVLDEFSSIDKTTNVKIDNIETTADNARLLTDELDKLGEKTERTADEQRLWLETCKRLTQTIPGLSSIINVETGEVNGGTQAVREYVKAWEDGQKKLAMLGAIQQKQTALDTAFENIPGLQLDMAVAERRVRENRKKIDAILAKYGLSTSDYGSIMSTEYAEGFSISTEDWRTYNELIQSGWELEKAAETAKYAYQNQADALEEAKLALEEYMAVVNEMPDGLSTSTEATQKWTSKQEDALKTVATTAQTLLQSLNEYVDGVRDATGQAVDSVVKGFESIKRPTSDLEQQVSDLLEEQNKCNRSTKDGEKRYQELDKQIKKLNESISQYRPSGMQDALESQLAFMDEYIANLEKAQQMGLSNELLSSLSDGSVESAEYLAQLVQNPEQAKDIDTLYGQVQTKKKELTDVLTQQKLSVDDTFQAMVDKANEAVKSLDLGGEAETATASTISGIATGVYKEVPAVKSAVDAVLAELNRLNGLGFNFSIGSGGFLAGVQNGAGGYASVGSSPGVDYDTLGNVMSDNVKAGGNVYLDGRTVGKVVSNQQGNSYRALTRSGQQQ